MFPIVNFISFSPLDQKLLRFSPLLDHITEITCHLFRSAQFDFEEGNLRSGSIELLSLLPKRQPVLLKLIDLDHQMFCKTL